MLQNNLAKFAKGRFVFSWLISLFILFGLSGCGGTDSSSASTALESDVPYIDDVPAKIVAYNFYDENLDFLGNASSDEINLTEEIWYAANSDEPYKETFEGDDEVVRLYAAKNVKEVKTQEDLENIALNLGGNYILLNDITLEGEWTPIGDENEPFSGILNSDTSGGERYAIKALKITLPNIADIKAVGLFGYIKNAIIKNIGIILDKIEGEINVGGLAGKAVFSNITNSYVIGNISGSGYVGGLVGHAGVNNNITNSYANVSIDAINDVGGLVGYIDGSFITNSYATGSISAYTNIGGIAGYFNSSALVSAYAAVGGTDGIVGGALFSGNISASVVIEPAVISDRVRDFTGGLLIGYVVDTASSLIFSNGVTYTLDYILSMLNYDLSGKLEAYLTKFFTNIYDKIWDATIDRIIVSHLDEEYVYGVNLGWKFGKDDANPWITPEGGGAPILYWQTH
ncbi:MAG: hypothetical protein LBT96_01020 [Campylobacteraceae bacterium]|jgi:hypothetical protein|nr:hypothetical protein [Campylobacteraceae bacterium]